MVTQQSKSRTLSKLWQKLWRTIAIVRQIWFAMVYCIRISNIVLWCFIFNVDHLVKHATLSFITNHVLFQSINAAKLPSQEFLPELLASAGTWTYPQAILQTVEPIDNVLYCLRLAIKTPINYSRAAWLNNMRRRLQKHCHRPTHVTKYVNKEEMYELFITLTL